MVERIRKVNERLTNIQKEIEIELKIKDGLERMVKARLTSAKQPTFGNNASSKD